ncbi:unnamed protein product [Acanthoscelides obtectus]|uniref:Uncharacterized protein n=1 Tax=Acanthoscelides obtectus TaxID=200917 RepID=A0A9P0Q6I5_ACAOB|nr:unnamed protein product [Acanthoscelides obtectus]CAH2010841.1 unnamed protein product [Acanthoscelides obtectus]CAK1629995.1 hypothetical protein AOBTE_LOCUS6086 [Acanthoscelides obtectus]CAK1630026.1 hypothetical protein AOBTE_LOCUS6111 [Acanthoscelides obtectus]
MRQEYHFLPIDQRRLFLDECCLYSLKLLTIQVSSDGLTPFQKLIMNNSSCCPLNTQQNLVWVQGSLGRAWYRISRRQSMIRTLRIRIQDPFFVAG